jgi:hypothetical protein
VSALIAGLDISSKRIDAALIPLDPDDGSDAPAVTLRSYALPVFKAGQTTPAYRSVERCRVIRGAIRDLLAPRVTPNPATYDRHYGWRYHRQTEHEVVHVCVEEPFGGGKQHRPSDNVLREIYGAILASIPPHIERDTIRTQEWRSLMLLPYLEKTPNAPKHAAIWLAHSLTGIEMDEHQAEAYLIARACRARLERDTKSAA